MKAILVVDVDNINDYIVEVIKKGNKSFLPRMFYKGELKPMPQKKKSLSIDDTIIKDKFGVETIYFEKAIKLAIEKGWNECIDEILGDKK